MIYMKNIKVFRLVTLNILDPKEFFKKHICHDEESEVTIV